MTGRTSNTGEKLSSEILYLCARKRHKAVEFQKVENTLSKKIGDYTDVISKIECVPEVYAFISVVFIIESKSRQDAKLNT